MISGGDGGEIVGGGVYTFELEAPKTGHSRMITFTGAGITGGLPANLHGPSSWSDFVATEPLLLDEFEGGGRIASAGAAVGAGGGFSVLIFYCGDRPTQKVEGIGASSGVAAGASWFHGWWEIRD